MRVLIVDDDADSLEIFSTLCRLWGHHVHALQQPTLAVSTALEFLPDVILLDLAMPEVGGCEIARCMRQQQRLERAFLVAVTGYGMAEDRARTFEAGFDAHLLKPVEIQDLKRFLEKRPHPVPRPRFVRTPAARSDLQQLR